MQRSGQALARELQPHIAEPNPKEQCHSFKQLLIQMNRI